MSTLIAHATGLTCQHCVRTVTTALEAVDGIDAVAVDLVNGGESTLTIDLTTDDDVVATIAQALASEGYTLTSVSAGEG
jgi:copper chaperone CopZ